MNRAGQQAHVPTYDSTVSQELAGAGASMAADLAYEASIRAHDSHCEAVKQFRSGLGVIVSAGVAVLTYLAKAGIDAWAEDTTHQGTALRAIVAGTLSVGFAVFASASVRLRRGLAVTQHLDSISRLSAREPEQVKFEVARAIQKGVRTGQSRLRSAQREAGLLVLTLAASSIAWMLAIAEYR
jgi:hypothetical protein